MKRLAIMLLAGVSAVPAIAENPIVGLWNATARRWGICYSRGYHHCEECEVGPQLVGPIPQGVLHPHQPATVQHAGHGDMIIHQYAPAYMIPGASTIPEQYTRPAPAPRHQSVPTPVPQPQQLAPPAQHAPYVPSVNEAPESPSDLGGPASGQSLLDTSPVVPAPNLIQSPQSIDQQIEIPQLNSSDVAPSSNPDTSTIPADSEPIISIPDAVAPSISSPPPIPVVPESVPSRITEPVEPPVIPGPPGGGNLGLPPGNPNDQDLLVPPDTGLLDSVQRQRGYQLAPYVQRGNAAPTQSRYQTAQLRRRVIREPDSQSISR